MIRHLFPYLGVAGLLVAMVVAGLGEGNGPHDFSGRCEQCHLVAPEEGQKGIFVADIDYLCRRCHDVKEKNSHPSEVVPSMEMPVGFMVDWQGRVTCATCHDPHAENHGVNGNLLRGGGLQGREFCFLCHQDFFDRPGGGHVVASNVAHTKSWTPPVEGGVLDEVSLNCISCHGGAVGPAADFQVAGESRLFYMGRSLSHPIGIDYSAAAAHNRELRPLEELSPLVSLYEGKLGCTSCHSLFSDEADLLVFNNRGSDLCLECHLK